MYFMFVNNFIINLFIVVNVSSYINNRSIIVFNFSEFILIKIFMCKEWIDISSIFFWVNRFDLFIIFYFNYSILRWNS